jgi:hypothetical protein
MKLLLVPVVAGFLATALAFAQDAAPPKIQVSDVLEMVQGGLPEDLIIAKLRKDKVAFDLTAQEMVQLKKAGVGDNVIKVMLDPAAVVSAAAPAAPTPAPAPAAAPAPPTAPAAPTSPGPVTEIGVYFKKAGAWAELPPEIVTFKTGGVLKTIGTAGIVKGDVNGHVNGENSPTQLKTPVTLLVYTPEGTAITEYQLLLLRDAKDGREFCTVTGGVLHSSSGATHDQVPFEGKKIAPRTWEIELPNISSGNYALLPPASADGTGTSGRAGKVFSFRVIE